MDKFLAKTLAFLGSFKLAVALFLLLFWLTFWGTLAQASMSLYDVQLEYFESLVVIFWWGDFPIPMIGGYLLLTILFVNLLVGGLLRMRYGKSTLGILIAHIGVLTLLFGSYVEHSYATKGQMTLYEGQRSDQYISYNEWEVAIEGPGANGGVREYVLPGKELYGLKGTKTARFKLAALPFDVVIGHYSRNSRIGPSSPASAPGTVVEPFALKKLPDVGAGDLINLPGAIVTLSGGEAGETTRAILWGGTRAPWVHKMGGKTYSFLLRRRTWDLPFTIQLDRFVHKRYAGTGMAKEFSSFITKTEDGSEQKHHITMNAPLRHEGYTFYQSGWGPQDAPEGAKLFSTFSVVQNPSDQVPLIACIIISIGLLLHYLRKLYLHLKSESRRQAQVGSQA